MSKYIKIIKTLEVIIQIHKTTYELAINKLHKFEPLLLRKSRVSCIVESMMMTNKQQWLPHMATWIFQVETFVSFVNGFVLF